MSSPAVVGRTLATDSMGAAVNICDTAQLAVAGSVQVFSNNMPCCSGAGNGINRELSQITRANKVVQSLRSSAFVFSELVDRIAERVKILLEHGFFGVQLWSSKLPAANGR